MDTLLTLIKDYKTNPSDKLHDVIWKFITAEENAHYFEDVYIGMDANAWVEYGDNLRIKKIQPQQFIATEIVRNVNGGYFCLLHSVNLTEYSREEIEEHKDNFPEYMGVYDDEDFFAVAAIASVAGVDDALSIYLAEDDIALEAWACRIEEQYTTQKESE